MKTLSARKFFRNVLAGATMLCTGLAAAPAMAANDAPSVITVGTLYASSGAFSAISMPVYNGLKLWVQDVNAHGGVYVKPYGKKIPVKLVAYDDQSSPATATTLYNQLITQDKVDILTSDSGSVLTSVAVPLAREHKVLLFNQTGTGTNFFSADNPYNVLLDDTVSSIWPQRLAEFLTKVAPKHGIHKVAIIYSTNDFTGAQAKALHDYLEKNGDKVKIVYYNGVPTSTTNYLVLLHRIQATNPDAVIEMGYPNNCIAFNKDLHSSGMKFKMVFTIYSGLETELLQRTAGNEAILNGFTYVPATNIKYKASYGMDIDQFRTAYRKLYGATTDVGFNAVSGYNTGLIIEKTLGATAGMDAASLRKSVFSLSGNLTTLDGAFKLADDGSQIGDLMPIGQLQGDAKHITLVPVYPEDLATGKPIFGK